MANEQQVNGFDELLLLKGLGPRTLQSLTLVSEVIHDTPSRFKDPAKFSFAHGGKGARPFPVPNHVYDETIQVLKKAVEQAKIGRTDKAKSIQSLTRIAQRAEKDFIPGNNLNDLIKKENEMSKQYGGKSIHHDKKSRKAGGQLDMF